MHAKGGREGEERERDGLISIMIKTGRREDGFFCAVVDFKNCLSLSPLFSVMHSYFSLKKKKKKKVHPIPNKKLQPFLLLNASFTEGFLSRSDCYNSPGKGSLAEFLK